ncbi:hypothetical protein C8Q77DRAFT_213873 [Trametes polyzona]|nr:hypothetical protein C8Q77DRAFT_213873 [Trametes polyzona]
MYPTATSTMHPPEELEPEGALYLSATQSVLSVVSEIHTSTRLRVFDLDSLFYGVRGAAIEAVTRAVALGLFTFVAVTVVYIIMSRKWRGGAPAIILFVVLPDCFSTLVACLLKLSEVAQGYALMGAIIQDAGNKLDEAAYCMDSFECDGLLDRLPVEQPAYTRNGCFGTALIAADSIMQGVVVCGAVALFLLSKPRNKVVYSTLLFVPLLAACVAAGLHVKNACSVVPIPTPDDGRWIEEWEAFDPRDMDVTTTRPVNIPWVVSLLLVVLELWNERSTYRECLRDRDTRRRWMRWLGTAYFLPVFVKMGWRMLHATYANEPSTHSVLRQLFFSAGEALLVPLMDICPGLVLLTQKLGNTGVKHPSEDKAPLLENSTPPEVDVSADAAGSKGAACLDTSQGDYLTGMTISTRTRGSSIPRAFPGRAVYAPEG